MRKSFFLFLLISMSTLTFSQVGINTPWVWMKGPTYTSDQGTYGTIGFPAPSNNPHSRMNGITFSYGNDLYLFGGFTYLPAPMWYYFNDLWKFDPATNNWTWIKGSSDPNQPGFYGTQGVPLASNNPGARDRAAAWSDGKGNFWLFGGDGVDRLGNWGNLNDLWRYNISENNWTWMGGSDLVDQPGNFGVQGVSSSTNLPPPRGGSSSWTDRDGNFWMFGGYHYNFGASNDLWKYDPEISQWVWMKGSAYYIVSNVYGTQGVSDPANTPGSRHASAHWVVNDDLYLFGGNDEFTLGSAIRSDLWKYSTITNEWTWVKGPQIPFQLSVPGVQGVAAVTNNPGARWGAAPFKDITGNIWLFGGYGYSASAPEGYQNDLWMYTPANNQWTWMKDGVTNSPGNYGTQGVPALANTPGSRYATSAWSDNAGNFWMFGGLGFAASGLQSELSDLWKINSFSLLPVKLISFTGVLRNNETLLQWKVDDASTTANYVIERSFDGRNFNRIGEVLPVSNKKQYHYADPLHAIPAAKVFYHLQIIEHDNRATQSEIISFKLTQQQISIYPNPVADEISFRLPLSNERYFIYKIHDASGRQIRSGQITNNGTKAIIDVRSLPPGRYQLQLVDGKEIMQSSFIKR